MNLGDYVRYKTLSNQIKINKIINIVEPNDGELSMTNIILYDLDNKDVTADKYIIKSSPNIIDLIEVGDIVNYEQLNGGVVLNKKDDSIDTWSILPNSLKNEDIKSVITKEQLKNCMYEVGE